MNLVSALLDPKVILALSSSDADNLKKSGQPRHDTNYSIDADTL